MINWLLPLTGLLSGFVGVAIIFLNLLIKNSFKDIKKSIILWGVGLIGTSFIICLISIPLFLNYENIVNQDKVSPTEDEIIIIKEQLKALNYRVNAVPIIFSAVLALIGVGAGFISVTSFKNEVKRVKEEINDNIYQFEYTKLEHELNSAHLQSVLGQIQMEDSDPNVIMYGLGNLINELIYEYEFIYQSKKLNLLNEKNLSVKTTKVAYGYPSSNLEDSFDLIYKALNNLTKAKKPISKSVLNEIKTDFKVIFNINKDSYYFDQLNNLYDRIMSFNDNLYN